MVVTEKDRQWQQHVKAKEIKDKKMTCNNDC